MGNLLSFFGIFVFIFIAWGISEDRRHFPWRVVGWGLLLQFVFGFLVLWWEPGAQFFLRLNDVFNALLAFSQEGALFVFNSLGSDQNGLFPPSLKEYLTHLGAGSTDPVIQNAIRTSAVPGSFLAFQILTTIIFFSALLSILYYFGIMQKVVILFAKMMAKTMRVSGAEALSNSANIFVGQTEAPLVIRPFIEKMTRSELMAIMVGGFANTAGGVLGAYVLMLSGYFPNIAAHLISASVLSAPAAFIMAKVMVPERKVPVTMGDLKLHVPIEDANVLDAAANGAAVGWQLAVNVGAMLIAFIALIAMTNLGVRSLGGFFHDASGLLRFNIVVAALLATLVLTKHISLRDTSVWWMLCAVSVVYLGARTILPAAGATTVGLVGFISWFSLFLQMDRKSPVAVWIPVTLLGAAIAANFCYAVFGPLTATTNLSLQLILGWMHWPVAFFMGTPIKDCLFVGQLLGEKLVLTEFVAYANLSGYLGSISRGEAAPLDARSIVIVSYALSGFSNFASIAIQIGGIAPLAPTRRQDIARLGLKAMIGGALASYALACVAGTFYTGTSMLGGR